VHHCGKIKSALSAKVTLTGTPDASFEIQLQFRQSYIFKKLLWMNLKELECMPN
jgi:hypothetical protein